MANPQPATSPRPNGVGPAAPRGFIYRVLNWIEIVGNKLPDPAMLFLFALIATWVASKLLADTQFTLVDPRTGEPLRINDQLSGTALAGFMKNMVTTFTGFHPLGVVLVALLGVGVAEHTGFINACLKGLLSFTPRKALTPMLIFVSILSHTAADAGYVLVIPLGGVIFYAAGRHPLAGIAAAFAGVSGGFSANPMISGIDPLLQGLTQVGGQVLNPALEVNPLCNWYFTAASSVVIVLVGWFLTDRVIEPRLASTAVDGDESEMPSMQSLEPRERRGMYAGLASMVVSAAVLWLIAAPATSVLRDPDVKTDHSLVTFGAPLMGMIVPLIFLFFVVPGIVHGYVSGSAKSHRDIIKGMSKSMSTMGYYLVMAFFAALFIKAFGDSNIGALVALKGAQFLKEADLPAAVTITGIIFLSGSVNLLVGSASAKWALLAPILVPMLMLLGISPDLTQAGYRVGDSTTNIITPLMPYFPLVVVFCQRYVKNTGIGTLISLMLPYSVCFLVTWTLFLLGYWALGIPLGVGSSYEYLPPS